MRKTRETEGGATVVLPGGYPGEDAEIHREVEIVPLDGAGEDMLANAPPDTCVARMVTMLLACSLRRIGSIRKITPALVRALLVEDRDFLITRLREKTLGPVMWVALECPHHECRKAMEVKLMLDEIGGGEQRPIAGRQFQLEIDPPVEFRLPVGADQEWAASCGISDPVALRNSLLARCLGRDASAVAALGAAVCDAIEARMEELVPDVTPELDSECPECRRPFTTHLDLPFLVLRELKSHAYRLEQDVHLLAWNYKWSERDILRLPRHKRERYVKLIEEELEARSG